jgi:hypothetical protein
MILLAFGAVAAIPRAAAAPASKQARPTTAEIGDAGDNSGWLEVRSLNFVLATDAGEAKGREALYELEQLRALLPVPDGRRLELFYFRDPVAFARYTGHRDGFLRDGKDMDPAIAAVNSLVALRHEYVHFATRSCEPVPCASADRLWVSEGLADYYATLQVSAGQLEIGGPNAAALDYLRRTPLLSVGELDDVRRESRYYQDPAARPLFYAESWALVHLLVTTGRPLRADLPGLDRELAAHIARGAPARIRRSPLQNFDPAKFQVRRMSEPEIALRLVAILPAEYRPEASAIFGPSVGDRAQDGRLAALETLAAKYPDYSPVWDRLGLQYLALGRDREALHAFERAMSFPEADGGAQTHERAQSWYLAGLVRLHDLKDAEGERLLYHAAALEPASEEYRRAWRVARDTRLQQEEREALLRAMSVHSPHQLDWPRTAARLAPRTAAPAKAASRRTASPSTTASLFGNQVRVLSCTGSGASRVCFLTR